MDIKISYKSYFQVLKCSKIFLKSCFSWLRIIRIFTFMFLVISILSKFTKMFDFLENDLGFWLLSTILLYSFEYVYAFLIYTKYNNKIIQIKSDSIYLPSGNVLTINKKKSKEIDKNEYLIVLDAPIFYVGLLIISSDESSVLIDMIT